MHAERLVYKLDTFTEHARLAQQALRDLIWALYDDLKAYKLQPEACAKAQLAERFDAVFERRTGFAKLDQLLKRLHANKAELLVVLDRPEIPLHTNGSENHIRCQVTKRKISGGTRSDAGRDCRDAFLGLAKNLRQARHLQLGLSRSPTSHPRPQRHSATAPDRKASLPNSMTARTFAPITSNCRRSVRLARAACGCKNPSRDDL